MSFTRETIYAALFAKLEAVKTAGTLVTAARRWKAPTLVAAEDQPAAFQAQVRETAQMQTGSKGPRKWKLQVEWHVYVNVGEDPAASTAEAINPILDALDAELEADPTLGGLVQHCRVVGEIQTDEGVLGPQGVAVMPIDITVTD